MDNDDRMKFHAERLPPLKEVMEKLGGLMILQDWMDIWSQIHTLTFKDQAIILTYEASDVLKTALYESQGRRKRNKEMFTTQIGDLIVMAMVTAVRENLDLYKCIKLTLERLENLEYKKSGAKTA